MSPLRPTLRSVRIWTEGTSAAGGALVALLATGRIVGPIAARIRVRMVAPPRLETYLAFLLAVGAAMAGVLASVALVALFARLGRRWIAPALVLVAVAVLGALRARWLGIGAPLAVLACAPMLASGRVRAVPAEQYAFRASLVCLAIEASCAAMGVWFRFATTGAAMLMPAMAFSALGCVVATARLADDARWRLVAAGLPALVLPFAGLARNPTLVPTAACCVLGVAVLASLARFPAAGARVTDWTRRRAMLLAMPALALFLVLPWHFRDIGVADWAGHEGQHLGWLNSIHFGKLMMADAGFTYGPLREYTLAVLAWLMGGLTLEHVRLAHVFVNVVGLVCVFAAMHRLAGRQVAVLVLGLALVVTHTAIMSFLAYTETYSFGWADELRAGLAVLAVVVALTRPTGEPRASRRWLLAAGVLAGLAVLYSHDQGIPAIFVIVLGLACDVLVHRTGLGLRARACGSARSAATLAVGVAVVVVPFLAVYAAYGKLGALFAGYRWTLEVSRGATPFAGAAWSVGLPTFDSLGHLAKTADPDGAVGSRVVDYVMAPAFAIMGLGHAAVAVVRRRVARRTTVILALATMQTMTLLHAFLAADPWHIANASTPGLVMLMTLLAGGRGAALRWRRRVVVPVGALAVAAVPVFWLVAAGTFTVNHRLERIASGAERPSTGEPYFYKDIPRTGDVGITAAHSDVVHYVREHSTPRDPVFCTTWLLGGGTEAFLSERRNPTSFDKPDEIVSDGQRERLRRELERDPPLFIVGDFFDYMGDGTRRLIGERWDVVSRSPPPVRVRKK